MDIGANHGLFGLFAAVLGAHVIQLEPQRELCKVRIRRSHTSFPADRDMRSFVAHESAHASLRILVYVFGWRLRAGMHCCPHAQVIDVARALNGPEVASRITLYNYAALDAREWIKLDAQVPLRYMHLCLTWPCFLLFALPFVRVNFFCLQSIGRNVRLATIAKRRKSPRVQLRRLCGARLVAKARLKLGLPLTRWKRARLLTLPQLWLPGE